MTRRPVFLGYLLDNGLTELRCADLGARVSVKFKFNSSKRRVEELPLRYEGCYVVFPCKHIFIC
jgi:hypothetical protein